MSGGRTHPLIPPLRPQTEKGGRGGKGSGRKEEESEAEGKVLLPLSLDQAPAMFSRPDGTTAASSRITKEIRST